jgi:hypothetical protein
MTFRVPSPEIGDDLAIAFPEALGDAADRYHTIYRGTVSGKISMSLRPLSPQPSGERAPNGGSTRR